MILTVRDFDSWYTSIRNTIYASGAVGMAEEGRIPAALAASVPYLAAFKDHYCMVREVIWEGTFAGRVEDKEYVRKVGDGRVVVGVVVQIMAGMVVGWWLGGGAGTRGKGLHAQGWRIGWIGG